MLWEASILSKRWAMHSNDTRLKFRRKQQCRLFQQKKRESLETRHKLFWWLTTQLKQAEWVWVLSSMNQKSKPEAALFPWREELQVMGEKWRSPTHPRIQVLLCRDPTAASATGLQLGRVQGSSGKGLSWENQRAEVMAVISPEYPSHLLIRASLLAKHSCDYPFPLWTALWPGNEMAKMSFQNIPCRHPLHAPGLRKSQREAAVKYKC